MTVTAADSAAALERTASHGPLTHLPDWSAITPEVVEAGLRELVRQTAAGFDALETGHTPTWDGLMAPLEQLEVRLGRAIGAVTHLISVKYSEALQAAHDAVRPDYVQLFNRMNQSTAIHAGMTALRDGPEWDSLPAARQRIVSESIRAMERSGVALTGAARARFTEIAERLSELSNDFQNNLVREEKVNRIRIDDGALVAGVPEAVLAQAAQTAVDDGVEGASAASGPWHFVINGPNYTAVMQQGEHRELRERMYRAFRSRGTSEGLDNRPVLTEILALRQEQSRLIGFDTYAERSIDAKMAPSVAAVWALFEQLEQAARPVAEREYEQLRAFMRERGAAEADAPAPWDIPYWSERLREARFDYDSERLREYFQMPRVLDGLFELTSRLYGVDIVRVDDDALPVWDESVEFFEVRRDGEVIAGFYVDPYARPGEKRGGAWMNTVVDRSLVLGGGDSATLPVALFVLNGRPPAAGRPGLMSLDEVRTLFHEFGHATQHMFTRIDDGGASGMNLVEWDAVELASQFNEYWMEHKPFLRRLTAHVDTGEPLDDDTLDRIIDSRNFMAGNATLRQLQFGKIDMALHERCGLGEDGPDLWQLERDIAAATLVLPTLPDESQLPAFGHLFSGGYAAGYYSYKWAEVLAADAFAAFREVGLDNDAAVREVAARFRDTVLALGGSLPAGEVYRLFRGRDASPEALLIDQGLLPAA